MASPVRKAILAGLACQVHQGSRESEGSVDCTACRAPKASQGPQVLTSTENQDSQDLLGTGVTQERPTPFQAPRESQDGKGSRELQGNEAQPGVQDYRGSLASPRLPTSLGHLATKAHQAYLAWKATEAHQGHLGLRLFLGAKEMMGVQELRESLGAKDGLGTRGHRAGLVCLVSQEKKVPGGSQDSWATLEPPGLWATEAPRGPKETRDSLVPLVLQDPQGLQDFVP